MNIFVNGVSSKVGGGKNILDNYLISLNKGNIKNTYYFLTPSYENYSKYNNEYIKIIDVSNWIKVNYLFLILYFLYLPKLLKMYKIDVIINFADIIIPTKIKQIYFFDWSYAVYEDDYVWKGMNFKDLLTRKIKVYLISKYISKVAIVLCQTETIKSRLKSRYDIKNIFVDHTPIYFLNSKTEMKYFNREDTSLKLFYPANESTHKNHRLIVKLIEKIEKLKLPYTVILTLDSENFKKIYGNLTEIQKQYIFNAGRLKLEEMPSLYKNVDYLLFPSLLETYGIPYIEAMYFGKPILTSDLDFARDLCGNAALYFNPFDSSSVLKQIKIVESSNYIKESMINAGKQKISTIPTWEQITEKYERLIENINLYE